MEEKLFVIQHLRSQIWRKDSEFYTQNEARNEMSRKRYSSKTGERYRLVKASSVFLNELDEPFPVEIIETCEV